MVAARRDERRLVTDALRELETKHTAVKGERALEVGDLEMHVADADAGIDGLCVHAFTIPQRGDLPKTGFVSRACLLSMVRGTFGFRAHSG